MLNRFSYLILCFILFIVAWPHGGELLHEHMFLLGVLSCVLATNLIVQPQAVISALLKVKWPLIFGALWVGYGYCQALVFASYIPSLSSVTVDSTFIESIKNTQYIVLFCLVVYLCDSTERLIQILNVMLISASLMALYSIVNSVTNGMFEMVSGIPPWELKWEKEVGGTFSYKNHYASYTAIALLINLGLTHFYWNKDSSVLTKLTSFTVCYHLMINILLFVALVKSSSRGAILAIAVISIIFAVVTIWRRRKVIKVKHILTSLVLLIVVAGTLTQSNLYSRLSNHGVTANGRDIMQQTVVNIWQYESKSGIGAGTYPLLQHKYKPPELGHTAMSKRAHNDYLEFYITYGPIGLLFFAGFIFSGLFEAFKTNKQLNRNKGFKNIKYALVGAIAYLAVHCAFDFNLAMPAIFVNVMVCLAILANFSSIMAVSRNIER
jgi:O-antigen ligase